MSALDPEIEKIFNDDNRTLAPNAVLTQVLLMSGISLATVFIFNILRPNNKIIYEPKVKYHEGDKPPPRISDSFLGWLPPLMHTKEPELVDKIGLDAVIFLRFLRMLRLLFLGVVVLAGGVLLPVNAIHNLKHVKPNKRDVLSMLTIRDVGGSALYAHIGVTYAITIFICVLLYMNWVQVVRLRKTWFRSPEHMQSFYARTLAVRQVPTRYQSDEGLRAVFDSTKMPYPTTSVHIGRKVGKLPELIEYHNQTVRDFEQVLVKYLKGGKIAKKRPTITIGATCGIGGSKKDAIDFYTAKLKRTEGAIEEYRAQIDNRKAEPYGFASLAAVPYAHIVARKFEGKRIKGVEVTLAPNPKDIIWENMHLTDSTIFSKKFIGYIWLALVCTFNTVPLLVISVLANLSTISGYVDFLGSWSDSSPASFTLVSGVLPPAVSAFFAFFLPIIMRKLMKFMGALTHSRLDRAVVARYFAFLVISQLIIFTLIGVIFNSVMEIVKAVGKKSFQEIIQNLDKLPSRINSTYINQSSYWLTFFPLRGFLVLFDLAQIINLVWIFIKTHLFGRTPRDIREWTQPPEFEYAIYFSNLLFMAAVGLVFAPLAPLVSAACMVVFWLSSWVYKYQLMFVFISKVESGGRLWNVVVNRLLFCVILMQSLMTLTIGLQHGWLSYVWVAVIPPIFIVIGFKMFINRKFLNDFKYYKPTEEELRMAKVHSERSDHKGNRLEKRFGHPSLHADLFTPMLHAKMMPLLSQVYAGSISQDKVKLDEYRGQQMSAQVVPGGIRIAAIDQQNLEYDPAMYQRDRGEQDWDARSMASTNVFGDGASLHHSKSGFYAHGGREGASTPVPSMPGMSPGAYDRYMNGGANSEIELKRMDTQELPLLSPHATSHFNTVPVGALNHTQSTMSIPTSMYQQQHAASPGDRQAPVHRPQMSGYDSYGSYGGQDSRSNSPAGRHSPAFAQGRHSPSQQQHQRQSSQPLDAYPPYRDTSRSGTPMSSPGSEYPPSYTTQPPAFHRQQSSLGQQASFGGLSNMAGRGTFQR
ncbi:DUF221-domain-containing protein [Pterulicium gracile]|uniref:DUF221-domain-containing protein n=1 Tax=Pterulicium gracile TaxID=1884261 RepID=A0A5C3R363_9AGAR|nr:DUF221-domain-containing protein [Pterula gracilis]